MDKENICTMRKKSTLEKVDLWDLPCWKYHSLTGTWTSQSKALLSTKGWTIQSSEASANLDFNMVLRCSADLLTGSNSTLTEVNSRD